MGNRTPVNLLKWAGSKYRAIPNITRAVEKLPQKPHRYVEPFLGSGVVFLALWRRGLVTQAILGDGMEPLMAMYLGLQVDAKAVGTLYNMYCEHGNSELFYKLREETGPQEQEDALELRAARFLFLARSAYNGVVRITKTGKFSVPVGSRPAPPMRMRTFEEWGDALQCAQLCVGPWGAFVAPLPKDLWYFDPPYDGGWTGYSAQGFSDGDQLAVADRFHLVRSSDSWALAHNYDTEFVRNIYQVSNPGIWHVVQEQARVVGGRKSRMSVKKDIMIANWPLAEN